MSKCSNHKVYSGDSGGYLDLCVPKGITFELNVIVDCHGCPSRLLGHKVKFTVITAHNNLGMAVYNTTLGGDLSLSGVNSVKLVLPVATIEGFKWCKGRYSLDVFTPAGVTKRVLRGKIVVTDL